MGPSMSKESPELLLTRAQPASPGLNPLHSTLHVLMFGEANKTDEALELFELIELIIILTSLAPLQDFLEIET